MIRRSDATGRFEQVLTYCNGPQLIVLKADDKSKIIAVATDEISDYDFFGARISKTQFESYLDNNFDLRYTMINADRRKYYEFNLDALDEPVPMFAVELTAEIIASFIPDHGLFAADNSDEYVGLVRVKRYTQTFHVDGRWSMPEFSKFNGQLSDLYALAKGTKIFADQSQPVADRKLVAEALVKPFEGGGSYLGMFRSLAEVGGREAKPEIKAIQWASPGYIKVLGQEEAFEQVIAMVRNFGVNEDKVIEQYDHLWSYLSEMKLLKARSNVVERGSSMADEIVVRTKELADAMALDSYQVINNMAFGNVLIIAKVILSIIRRTRKLHAFFAQGRVSVKEHAID